MIKPAPSNTAAAHCYGIVLHHRLAWWLVEFPDLDATPLRARKLSGRLTPAPPHGKGKNHRENTLCSAVYYGVYEEWQQVLE